MATAAVVAVLAEWELVGVDGAVPVGAAIAIESHAVALRIASGALETLGSAGGDGASSMCGCGCDCGFSFCGGFTPSVAGVAT